ncbi:hypothetical protein K0M31_016178 [Melipona bicolor]|uniref:Uncharacterized protein n=1 Tax=Melipona bicolor TaxID=60889 RepID=A0AA40G6J2_9HYME|nr:hypothetical protein K0M31_016178 [Melipona bicolor]
MVKPIKHLPGFTSNFSGPRLNDALFRPAIPPLQTTHTYTRTGNKLTSLAVYTRSVFLVKGARTGSEVMFASADAADAICVQNGPKLKLEGWRPMEEYIEEVEDEEEEEDEGEVTEEGNEEKLRKREG